MKKKQIFLNEVNHNNNKQQVKSILKKNLNIKAKEEIQKEILESIKQNMNNIKTNLCASKESINVNDKLNTQQKEDFINYNGENISMLSNNSGTDNNVNVNNVDKNKVSKNILINENPESKDKESNDNEFEIIPVKKNSDNLSRNLHLFDSSSTSNTYHKKINNISINKNNITEKNSEKSDKNTLKKNEAEIISFFWDIRLPSSYAFKFIENGFDDLNVIIEMEKTGIAISNKNLEDIGFSKAGERAKILIYLEDKAGVFPIILEKKILFKNKDNFNSLSKFLEEYDCSKFINNFKNNGYYNSELLFCQMLSREPITKDNIIKDFGIKEEYYINNILKGLEDKSQIYLKKLSKKNNNIDVNNISNFSCESCLIF